MRDRFKAIVANYPDQWNINNYPKFARLVRTSETAREAFDFMRGDPIESAWPPPLNIEAASSSPIAIRSNP